MLASIRAVFASHGENRCKRALDCFWHRIRTEDICSHGQIRFKLQLTVSAYLAVACAKTSGRALASAVERRGVSCSLLAGALVLAAALVIPAARPLAP